MRAIRCLIVLVLASLTSTGCNSLRSTIAPDFQGKTHPVEKLGIAGAGASVAAHEFIARGYQVVELGVSSENAVQKGQQSGLPFIAIIDAVDTSQAVWDGFYSFSMRVSDGKSGAIVWTGSATYGRGGVFIDQQGSSKEAYRDLVNDFAKAFPPATTVGK